MNVLLCNEHTVGLKMGFDTVEERKEPLFGPAGSVTQANSACSKRSIWMSFERIAFIPCFRITRY